MASQLRNVGVFDTWDFTSLSIAHSSAYFYHYLEKLFSGLAGSFRHSQCVVLVGLMASIFVFGGIILGCGSSSMILPVVSRIE